jgi:hypothetical protein
MSHYDTEQAVITGIGRAFTWPGRVGEFLGMWLLSSLLSWFVGGLPLVFVLLEYWLFNLDPDSGPQTALAFASSTVLGGLLVLGAFSLSGAERGIRRERRAQQLVEGEGQER